MYLDKMRKENGEDRRRSEVIKDEEMEHDTVVKRRLIKENKVVKSEDEDDLF